MAAEKRSISFDPKVLAEAERLAAEAHDGNLSALVNEAVEHQVKLTGLRSLLDEMDEEFGPVSDRTADEVDSEFEEWESRSTRAR